MLLNDPSDLSYALFTKRCDAIVADAPALAVLRRQAPDRYGALVGRIVTREKYAIAFEKGSQLRPRIDAVLRQLRTDGTLAHCGAVGSAWTRQRCPRCAEASSGPKAQLYAARSVPPRAEPTIVHIATYGIA